MNKQILWVMLIAVAMPIVYFLYLEGFDPKDLKSVPQDFVNQAIDIFTSEEKERSEAEEALDFLRDLPEVEDSEKIEKEVIRETVESAIYEVTLDMDWSGTTHAGYFPDGAHVSPFVAWTHLGGNRIFCLGEPSSAGMEKMAELGGTVTLELEIEEEISKNVIATYVTSNRIDVPGMEKENIEVLETHTSITLVSMLAPSSDWFLSVQEISLVNQNGEFVESLEVPFVFYDAGTEEGKDFSAKNPATEPQGVITKLETLPLGSLPPFGKVRFNKI